MPFIYIRGVSCFPCFFLAIFLLPTLSLSILLDPNPYSISSTSQQDQKCTPNPSLSPSSRLSPPSPPAPSPTPCAPSQLSRGRTMAAAARSAMDPTVAWWSVPSVISTRLLALVSIYPLAWGNGLRLMLSRGVDDGSYLICGIRRDMSIGRVCLVGFRSVCDVPVIIRIY